VIAINPSEMAGGTPDDPATILLATSKVSLPRPVSVERTGETGDLASSVGAWRIPISQSGLRLADKTVSVLVSDIVFLLREKKGIEKPSRQREPFKKCKM